MHCDPLQVQQDVGGVEDEARVASSTSHDIEPHVVHQVCVVGGRGAVEAQTISQGLAQRSLKGKHG